MPTVCMKKQANQVSNRNENLEHTSSYNFSPKMESSNVTFLEKGQKTEKQLSRSEAQKQNSDQLRFYIRKNRDQTFGPNFCLIPLCCRTYFFELERILPAEDKRIEYKSYKYPFNPASLETLKKNICAFLNTMGGEIYIGIKETTNKKYRYVLGNYLTENDKEEILKRFRKLSESVYPRSLENLEVEFVPIRKSPYPEIGLKEQSEAYYYDFSRKKFDLKKCPYIPARYVVRVRVAPGKKDAVYSYVETECQLNKNSPSDQFIPFRAQNQVLVKEISQEILKFFKSKLISKNQLQIQRIHSGSCCKPELGSPRNQPEPSSSVIDLKKIQASLEEGNAKTSKHLGSQFQNQKIQTHQKALTQVETLLNNEELKTIFKNPLSFIVLNCSFQKLLKCINKTPARDYSMIESFKNCLMTDTLKSFLGNESEILVISIDGYHHMTQFVKIMKKLEDHFAKYNLQFIGIAKFIKVEDPNALKIMETQLEKNYQHKHAMRKRGVEFYSLGVAAFYLLYMRQLGYHLEVAQE